MATALRSSPTGSNTPDRQLARLFEREIAPHIRSLAAERAEGRARFITTASAFAIGIAALLYALWPVDPGWAALAAAVPLAIGVNVLGSQQRKFRHRVRDLVMPAICQAAGELQHGAGDAPGIPFDDLEQLGLLPRHNRRTIDDLGRSPSGGTDPGRVSRPLVLSDHAPAGRQVPPGLALPFAPRPGSRGAAGAAGRPDHAPGDRYSARRGH
jgi:hypothetical protein